jgi:hypothetical protein
VLNRNAHRSRNYDSRSPINGKTVTKSGPISVLNITLIRNLGLTRLRNCTTTHNRTPEKWKRRKTSNTPTLPQEFRILQLMSASHAHANHAQGDVVAAVPGGLLKHPLPPLPNLATREPLSELALTIE